MGDIQQGDAYGKDRVEYLSNGLARVQVKLKRAVVSDVV